MDWIPQGLLVAGVLALVLVAAFAIGRAIKAAKGQG